MLIKYTTKFVSIQTKYFHMKKVFDTQYFSIQITIQSTTFGRRLPEFTLTQTKSLRMQSGLG